MDYSALAQKFGGTTLPTSTGNVDYSALAQKFGGSTISPGQSTLPDKNTPFVSEKAQPTQPQGFGWDAVRGVFQYNPISIAGGILTDTAKGVYNSVTQLPGKLYNDVQAGAKDITSGLGLNNQTVDPSQMPNIRPDAVLNKPQGITNLFGKGDQANQDAKTNVFKGIVKSTFRPAADVALTYFSPIISAFGSLMNRTKVTDALNATASYIVDKSGVTSQPWFQDYATSHPNTEEDLNRALTLIIASGDKTNIDPIKDIKNIAEPIKVKAQEIYQNYKDTQATSDAAKLNDLANKVGGGKIEDIVASKNALATINVTPNMTNSDVAHQLELKSENIQKAKTAMFDTKPQPIPFKEETFGGHNFVDDALTQLEDNYRKENDVTNLNRIQTLRLKAETQGLSVGEIDKLAVEHGQQLSAYKANGQPSEASVRQNWENTRKGLKNTAREKFGNNPVYAQADHVQSDIINTQDLMEKKAEAVNKFKQTLQTRGFGAKAASLAVNVLDIMSGHLLKSFITPTLETIFPGLREVKINPLDLQSQLSSDIQKLQSLSDGTKSDAEVIKQMQDVVAAEKAARSNRLGLPPPTGENPPIIMGDSTQYEPGVVGKGAGQSENTNPAIQKFNQRESKANPPIKKPPETGIVTSKKTFISRLPGNQK